ncbi:M48 family metallopeptidase, partial [Massilia glaciei]
MDKQAYKKLVRSLETDAVVSPGGFRNKVLVLCATFHAVLGGMLCALLLLAGFGIAYAGFGRGSLGLWLAALLALALAPACFAVLRLCLTRLPAPPGRPLTRAEVPRLFSALGNIRKQLDGPEIHHVLLDDHFSVALVQRARWGLFGRPVNYLVLGLPFMQSMSPKEMLAAIAHEVGLVRGSRDRAGAWAYRQQRMAAALLWQLREARHENALDGLAARLLHKFMHYYQAHTLVLGRQNAIDADRGASTVVGAKSNAACLVRGALLERWIDTDFWPNLQRQANTQEQPLYLPYTAMRAAFKAGHRQWATSERLGAAWNERPGLSDPLPPLSARVEAIGEVMELPPGIKISAAEALLGERAKGLIDEFDQQWWKREQRRWLARHRYVSGSRSRLEELQRVLPAKLKLDELQELAMLCAEFEPPERAKRLHEYLLDLPGGPYARAEYDYGCLLLAERNENGLEHLATAARADRELTA